MQTQQAPELHPDVERYLKAMEQRLISRINERTGQVEREVTQLRKWWEDELPTRSKIQFVTNQSKSAFIGVLELRKLWQADQSKASNKTRMMVAIVAAIALLSNSVNEGISRLTPERVALAAGKMVDERLEKYEEHQAEQRRQEIRDAALAAVRLRDQEIDTIRGTR